MESWIISEGGTLVFGTLLGTLCLAALWEAVKTRRPAQPRQTLRWAGNLSLGVINQGLAAAFGAASSIIIAWWVAQTGVGLLARAEFGFFASLVTTVLALELAAYFAHRLMHQVPLLWRFHRVHHSDPVVDFTTTLRNHPLEVLTTAAVATPVTALLGPSLAILIIYQMARSAVVILAHSNIYLPYRLDRMLRHVIITPDYHRLHHAQDRQFTDSNYGVFLTLFDRVFGTASDKPFDDVGALPVGLDYGREMSDSKLGTLLAMPFIKETHTAIRPDSAGCPPA
ncbi:MAG: sterol desaturase family protein [Pseudomonadota bacterium]